MSFPTLYLLVLIALAVVTGLGQVIWHRIKNPSPLLVGFKNMVVWLLDWIDLLITRWWAVPPELRGRYYGGWFVLIVGFNIFCGVCYCSTHVPQTIAAVKGFLQALK